jgi:fermentation-respiration switch protein FrsA (DUF1100 family)
MKPFAVSLILVLASVGPGCQRESDTRTIAELRKQVETLRQQVAEQQQQIRAGQQATTEQQERILTYQRQLAEERQILRTQSLEGTRQSLDERLALFPDKYPEGDWTPADTVFEDCWFPSADGLHLHGWYLRHDRPRAALLMIHGNAGNLSHRGPMVKFWHDRFALSAMIFDYRGYGRSEGVPTFDGILRDARAARRCLAAREEIPETSVVLLGESLGGAVAVDLAAEDGAHGLILESTFSSLSDVAATHYGRFLAAVGVSNKLNSISKIGKYHGPLLQSHGDRDQVVSFALARKLFDAANEPKTFISLPGKDHNDPKTDDYYHSVETFFSKLADRQ